MAAGGSSRLNSPKQLLNWQGEYLVNHIIQTAAASEIGDITVVLGCHKELIEPKIKATHARIIVNPNWISGLSSSIKCGISSLAEDIEGAFVILLDQPFISIRLFNDMIDLFYKNQSMITAPRVGRQQANPVLFRRDIFPELLQISGDKGAKGLLKKYKVKWLDWQDGNLLFDIDSQEDYQEALTKLNTQSQSSGSSS